MDNVNPPKINKDDVINKLKDDGDFDNLRLKIIRKLKDNEELRKNIISVVRQSATLNRPGAESMKPRQLSDAIFDEVGEKVMDQISGGLWEIIRSGSGMKNEIEETVQSVYNRLLNPDGKPEGEPYSGKQVQKRPDNNDSFATAARVSDDTLNHKPRAQPDASFHSDIKNTNKAVHKEDKRHSVLPKEHGEKSKSQDVPMADEDDLGAPPGFSVILESKQPSDDNDEDLDVPPGFG